MLARFSRLSRGWEIVSALGAVALSLSVTGCDMDRTVKQAFEPFFPPSPREAAQDMFNVYDPDLRRRSITLISAAKFGGEAPYVRSYRLLINDPDATVRAACVKALGEHGTVDDAKLLIERLHDQAEFVRWEAAKALQRIHNPTAVPPLMQLVAGDDDPDVRMAAACALGQYPEVRVFDTLVGALDDAEFGVVEASNESLKTLTGYNFGTDGSLWLIFKKQHPDDIFKNQTQYVWHPVVIPRPWYDKAQFWKTPATQPEPQPPIGIETEEKG